MSGYSPIEVVLDVRTYQDNRDRSPGGGGTDFFAGANEAFARHRNALAASLKAASGVLARNPSELGYIKVKMHADAHAKSHRPTSTLFPSRATPVVGLEDSGELIVQATSSQLITTAEKVLNAEVEVATKEKVNKKTGEYEDMPAPTTSRVEASAVAGVSVWSAADKRSFSAQQATKWAADKKLALRYRIDLFDFIEPQDKRVARSLASAGSYDSFFRNLGQALGGGYYALLHKKGRVTRLYLWLMKDMSIQSISQWQGRSRRVFDDVDLAVLRHESLLAFLDQSHLVRRIGLPSAFTLGSSAGKSVSAGVHTFSKPINNAQYPTVAVIDGGISNVLSDWISSQVVAVPRHHTNEDHGTEIGSLLVDGQAINGPLLCAEPDGCFLVDIGLMPTEDTFSLYYGDQQDFLLALNDEVRRAKESAGARVFCFAHNVKELLPSATYDEFSMGLDQIAVANDVVFVVSAGNLPPGAHRPEWKASHTDVLSDLATSFDDRVTAPGDSLFSLSVGALNPRSCTMHIAEAPARYSRRGPGFKGHIKPDVVHYGGHGAAAGASTELKVVTTDSSIIWNCGTSFAAPIVAKTMARIDQLTEGKLSREALIALCIHGTSESKPLSAKVFDRIRKDLIGYGVPPAAQEFLNGNPSSATLVFIDTLQPKKDMFFEFDWPACLNDSGSCRGKAWATLVYTPPVNDAFGAELIRVDMVVALHQRNVRTGKFDVKSKNVFKTGSSSKHETEQDLIQESQKWNNVKKVQFSSKGGVGQSSQWQVSLKYLERAEEPFPPEGVPFAIVLSISDLEQEEPVYQDMRASLSSGSVQTEDIHLLSEARIQNRRS
ncbi:S8 family peptidase [Undibacterium crateris]|uniref:S8 family peptidase n=1 Tax=Undibacterium crateris TaxID=2528175 RepID=UPI0013897A5D|nr:S8 family peptidase [Undibacterium crateris]NDI85475.1 S8 family serine peptidase [Undibacterium crateris]